MQREIHRGKRDIAIGADRAVTVEFTQRENSRTVRKILRRHEITELLTHGIIQGEGDAVPLHALFDPAIMREIGDKRLVYIEADCPVYVDENGHVSVSAGPNQYPDIGIIDLESTVLTIGQEEIITTKQVVPGSQVGDVTLSAYALPLNTVQLGVVRRVYILPKIR